MAIFDHTLTHFDEGMITHDQVLNPQPSTLNPLQSPDLPRSEAVSLPGINLM